MQARQLIALLLFVNTVFAASPKLIHDKLEDVFQYIDELYIEPVTSEDMTNHAITGMLQSLDDYSSYLTSHEANFLETIINGGFVGIGATIKLTDQVLTVDNIIPNSPASEYGLKEGDIISHINGETIDPIDLFANILRMRGAEGTFLTLQVLRPHPVILNIKRGRVDVEEVSYTEVDHFAYIELKLFTNETLPTLRKAIKQARIDEVEAIILDLRRNPGGLLHTAIEATALFLEKIDYPTNDITQIIRKDHIRRIPLPHNAHDLSEGLPIYILISPNTASGAEILASALQSFNRAVLFGETTRGKGSIQSLIPLKDNSLIKLTTAYFTSPDGERINQVGVKPDYPLKLPNPSMQQIVAKIRNTMTNGDLL